MAPLRALAERESATWEAFLNHPDLQTNWLPLAVFEFIRFGLETLRRDLEENPARWEDPGVGIEYAVPEEWVRDFVLSDDLAPERLAEGFKTEPDLVALLFLTKRTAYGKDGEEYVHLLRPELEKALEELPPESRSRFLEGLATPYTIGGDWGCACRRSRKGAIWARLSAMH